MQKIIALTNRIFGSSEDAVITTKYTRSVDTSGWLKVKLEPSGGFAFLCEYTKVLVQRSSGGRTYFLINEGIYANKTASVADTNALRCLISYTRGTGASIRVKIKGRQEKKSTIREEDIKPLNQLVAELSFLNKSIFITLDSDVVFLETDPTSPNHDQLIKSKPLKKGEYKIMTPMIPKDKAYTDRYRTHRNGYSDLKYDVVWFPVEDKESRNSKFIHVGHLSEGCITIYDFSKWNDLYQYLITNRMDVNGKYIGTVTIE
jgi:hypothetical protein